jgi:alkaline phosphatase
MTRLSRRRFLESAAKGLGAGTAMVLAAGGPARAADADSAPISFGLVTDVHHADAAPNGTRYYRDSLAKLGQAVDTFNRRKVAFVVELGDLIDAGPTKEDELAYLRAADAVLGRFNGPRYCVLGNHCLAALSKREFLDHCSVAKKQSRYSFDAGPFHFVVLDADYRKDGTPYEAGNFTWTDTWVPAAEQQWLAKDLRTARGKKVVVFMHQNLHDEKDPHGVKNAPDVRKILESAGNVTAVLQGHMHTGGYARIGEIDYFTFRAMVEGPGLENNAYAVVTLDPSGGVNIEGFGQQPSKTLP